MLTDLLVVGMERCSKLLLLTRFREEITDHCRCQFRRHSQARRWRGTRGPKQDMKRSAAAGPPSRAVTGQRNKNPCRMERPGREVMEVSSSSSYSSRPHCLVDSASINLCSISSFLSLADRRAISFSCAIFLALSRAS